MKFGMQVRGQWVTHDGMPYDPIQGHGHKNLKVLNYYIFKVCLLRRLKTDS